MKPREWDLHHVGYMMVDHNTEIQRGGLVRVIEKSAYDELVKAAINVLDCPRSSLDEAFAKLNKVLTKHHVGGTDRD